MEGHVKKPKIDAETNSRITTLENRMVYYETYESIAAGTGGKITVATGATILLDRYEDAGDCLIVKTDSAGRPIDEIARTAAGNVITSTLDIGGNFLLSGEPSAYPVAIVYQIEVPAKYSDNVQKDKIVEVINRLRLEETEYNNSVSGLNAKNGQTAIDELQSKKLGNTVQEIGTAFNAATAQNIADTDFITFVDISLGNIISKITFANLKTILFGAVASITALWTFSKDKIAMIGTSTGKNVISTANTSATDYINTLPAKSGTFAMTSDFASPGDIGGGTPAKGYFTEVYENGNRVAEDFKTKEKVPSIYTTSTGYVSAPDNDNLNVGTNTFSFITEQIFSSGSTTRRKVVKQVSSVGFLLTHSTTNRVVVDVGDGTNAIVITSTNAITDGNFHKIGFIFGVDLASCKLIIDGVEDTTATKTGTYPSLNKTNTGLLYLLSINGTSHINEGRNFKLFNYALSVSEMQKYMYQDLEYSLIGASNTDLTLGNGSFATDTTAWWIKSNGTLTWNSGTSDATFTADGVTGSNQFYSTFTATTGKKYRVTFKAKSSNITNSFPFIGTGATQFIAITNPNLTNSYQTYIFEGTNATTTTNNIFIRTGVSLTSGQEVTFDDIVIQQIGCIAEYTEDTMTPSYWYDKSGNNNHATLTNANLINKKRYHQEIMGYPVDVRGANVASATTITPSGALFHVTGTTAIATINVPFTGYNGSIKIIPDGIFTWTTAGNIALAGTAVVGKAITMTYDATTSKWYPSYT